MKVYTEALVHVVAMGEGDEALLDRQRGHSEGLQRHGRGIGSLVHLSVDSASGE